MSRSRSLRTTARRLAYLALACALVGCSSQPFEVTPPSGVSSAIEIDEAAAALRGPRDYNPDPRPISLCYSSQLNTPEEVMAQAQQLCPNQGQLQYYSEDFLLNDCALLQPQRVTFICTPGPPPPSPYN